MKQIIGVCALMLIMLFALSGPAFAQSQTGQPLRLRSGQASRPSLHEQQANELKDMKDDIAKMQSLINQMQAVFALVGNPTSPANHELELNIDMWRILINRMQRRVERMERMQAGPKG